MNRAPTDMLISVRDLVVGFDRQIVLDHLALDVRRGEILGVVGASGSGKSVLLRTVIGLLPKRKGTITIAGSDRTAKDELDFVAGQIGRRGLHPTPCQTWALAPSAPQRCSE